MIKVKKNAAFTILEMLAVMAIIMTIISIGVPAYSSWRNRSRITKARADIAKLEMALEMYKTDFGVYPATGQLNDLKVQETAGFGPYIDNKEYDLNNSIFNDPWGRAYLYVNNGSTVTITSQGPDPDDGSDDMTNVGAW